MSRQNLLELMTTTRRHLLDSLQPDQRDLAETLADGWSLGDTLAHLATWERVAIFKLTGTPLPYGDERAWEPPWDLDRFNNLMLAYWRTQSEATIRAEFTAAHQALLEVVDQASDEDCAPGGTVWQAIAEDGPGHYPAHATLANPWETPDSP